MSMTKKDYELAEMIPNIGLGISAALCLYFARVTIETATNPVSAVFGFTLGCAGVALILILAMRCK